MRPEEAITEKGMERVRPALDAPCGGYRCDGGPKYFRKRRVGINWTVQLQCGACGRSLSGALARAEHPRWEEYREWDAALVDAHQDRVDQELGVERTERENRIRREIEAYREVQEEQTQTYFEWCRTTPEWHRLSARVIQRANGWCEACLSQRASMVHHWTYACGRLPPAWLLHAVCKTCHDRLHAAGDEWCIPGQDKSSVRHDD